MLSFCPLPRNPNLLPATIALVFRYLQQRSPIALPLVLFSHPFFSRFTFPLCSSALQRGAVGQLASTSKRDFSFGKDSVETGGGGLGVTTMDLNDPDLLLPSVLPFKKTQLTDRYPKGQTRGRHWKHLKQIIQAENYYSYPADEPTYVSIEAPPSMYPAKKYCDITGFEAPYTDPRTKLRYANTEVFKGIRSLPEDTIQGYLSLRNAAVVLK